MKHDIQLSSKQIEVSDSYWDIQDYYESEGWSDGLPVVPATEILVKEMVDACELSPDTKLGVIQPSNKSVTVEKVAINSVMAGCKPEYFPVVIAAIKAILRPEFNVGGVQATTGGAACVVVVNGPICDEIGIHSDAACFGPGFRANATIGRAVRLVIRNLGELVPGVMDKATLSTPGRFSFCFGENESRSPWESRQEELGYSKNSNLVTVLGVRGVYNIFDSSSTGTLALDTLVRSVVTEGFANYYQIGSGAQMTLVLSPEHANEIAAEGFSKANIREFIYRNARMPISRLKEKAHWSNRVWPDSIDILNDEELVPIATNSDDIMILVAGGDGRHSAWLAGWGVTRIVSELV
tara:strand:+ start:4600 stop:5655 length:1056 start_codon:yes stop_codon:yes gene_type:complete